MPFNFNKHAAKGNKFLKDLSVELGGKADTKKAAKILASLFRTLRNHLTLQENFQMLAQLPIVLKGVYVHDWSPEKKHDVSRKRNDFIMEYLSYADKNSMHSVADMERGADEIHAVLKILRKHISSGEFRDIEGVLPDQLKKLLREYTSNKKLTVKLISKNENTLSPNRFIQSR
jgi:uncharacterized protein (DUF2267 family)